MVFAVAGGGQLDTGYTIDNSLRFNGTVDSCYLSRTPSSTTNRQKFTISFWVKRAKVITRENMIFESRPSAGTYFAIAFRNSGSPTPDQILTQDNSGMNLSFSPLFRDVSAWYHFVFAFDTTQATASNRVKFYVNGTQVTTTNYYTTYPSQNANLNWNVNQITSIGGSFDPTNQSPDIYLAEAHSIDGQQLDASSFGEFDADSDIWKPKKYSGSYGTNGFYLDFENSGSLGADQSGNGNNFTPTNLASTDQMLDTPTNNFATGNPLFVNYWIRTVSQATGSQGNLEWSFGASDKKVGATISTAGGKWYAEMRVNSLGSVSALVSGIDANEFEIGYNQAGNRQFNRATPVSYGASFGAGDVIGFAVDQDNNQVTFYKNGVSQGTLTNTFVGNAFFIGAFIYNANITFNFGQDSTFAGRETAASNTDGNGYGEFHHSVPSGYLALCTQNLATELTLNVDKSTDYFNIVLYTGTSTTNRTVTGVGFQPDFTWFKGRTPSAIDHALFDSNRGATKILISNNTNAEITVSESLKSFNSDGVTLGNDLGDYGVNNSARTYVLWSWKANAGSTSSNTNGSITSTVQANPTAGFSIVTYTGTGSTATVGHGLGVVPSMIITKKRSQTSQWAVYTKALGPTGSVFLNTNGAFYVNSIYWNNTNPTNAVWTMNGQDEGNGNGQTYVAYCFAEIEGYSKFGKYTGNGSTDGSFIYTGFRPAWIVYKMTTGPNHWFMQDNKRPTVQNPCNSNLYADLSNAEVTNTPTSGLVADFVSNGIKLRGSGAEANQNGQTFIYMCFAENPFVTSTGVAGTAR